MSKKITVTPLGGLGEIGKNMTMVEYGGRIVVIDCGLMFPTSEMLGVDLVLPDFEALIDRAGDIEAVVLTHGHEDHVGALPYFLRQVDVPVIYGGRLTVGMVRSKLDEHKLKDAPLELLEPGNFAEHGPFEIETVHLTHSIPDATGVHLRTELGSVLFTGDYKFDQTPVDGRPSDLTRLAEIGDEGLLLLCGDSTNADRKGTAASESKVGPVIEQVFKRCEGRIVITSFASNVHRVQQVIDAAIAARRKVCVVGRSMRKYLNVARNLGIADVPDGLLISTKELDSFRDEKVVIITTGSQGEPLSALRRMSHGEHREIELYSGDTVIFSATPIPGNEIAINETVNRLYKIGCRVITTADEAVHASGHGFSEELSMMINLTKPRYMLPVHGDYRRLTLHGEIAVSAGVEPDNVFIGENGLPLHIEKDRAYFGAKTPSNLIFVDGIGIGDTEDVALRDRRTLSQDGIVVVVATVSVDDGELVSDPEVIVRGVPFTDEDDELVLSIKQGIEALIEQTARDDVTEIGLLQELIREDVSKTIAKSLRKHPMVIPAVIEV